METALEAHPPVLQPSYEGRARDETSNVLIPIPLPSHVSPAPKDVMKMFYFCNCRFVVSLPHS